MPVPTSEIGHSGIDQHGQLGHIGYRQTLSREDIAELRWPYVNQTWDWMRRDSKVASSVRSMFLPILAANWHVMPRQARPEVVERIADDLNLPILGEEDRQPARTRDRFDWQFFIRHALLSRIYGFMPFEQVYRIDGDGRPRIRKLAVRMPHTIDHLDIAQDGGLNGIVQRAITGSRGADVPIPISRLVMFTHEREGYDWHGTSILRSVYRETLLKDHGHEVAAIAMTRNGVGIPIYEDPDPTKLARGSDPKAEAAAGQKLAESYRAGESAGGRIPYSASLTLKGVEGQTFDILAFLRYYDETIAQNVLDNFSSLGSARNGSRALGQTNVEFFTQALNAHAQDIANVTTNHVVEDYVDEVYGPGEAAPGIGCGDIGANHHLTAAAIKQLIDAGALTPDRPLEDHIRRDAHLPTADPVAQAARLAHSADDG